MTGLAAAPSAMANATSSATGAASSTRSRGVVRAVTLQKRRMPTRLSATRLARPEASTARERPRGAVTPAAGAASIAVESSANFATNPGQRRQPRHEQHAAHERQAEKRHRSRNRDADVLVSAVRIGLRYAEGHVERRLRRRCGRRRGGRQVRRVRSVMPVSMKNVQVVSTDTIR